MPVLSRMSDGSVWAEAKYGGLFSSHVKITGKGLGIISQQFFKAETWAPLMKDAMGKIRFGHFVAAIMGRIELQESDSDEIRSFVSLIATDSVPDFMTVALPHMPQLQRDQLLDPRNCQMALWFQRMRNAVRRRVNITARMENATFRHTLELVDGFRVGQTCYKDGLSEAEKKFLRLNLLGPDVGAAPTPSMERIFATALAIGYPQEGLDRLMQEAKIHNRDIERDMMGLPKSVLLPDKESSQKDTGEQEPADPSAASASGTHSSTSAAVPAATAPTAANATTTAASTSTAPAAPLAMTPAATSTTSAGPSCAASSSQLQDDEVGDSPPPELLVDLEFDDIDEPRNVTPKKHKDSDGKLPKITTVEEASSFAARRAESPNRPQVPADEIPAPPKTDVEEGIFRALRREPGPIFCRYFTALDPLPNQGRQWPNPVVGNAAATPQPAQQLPDPLRINPVPPFAQHWPRPHGGNNP